LWIVKRRANGIWFRVMADTGATGIVFSRADARRLGFDPTALRFDRIAWTANDQGRYATLRLEKLEIGPIAMNDVPAQFNDGELLQPLLGMEFLKRMSTVEIESGVLTIRRIVL
jgi:aspartyl protease family protein